MNPRWKLSLLAATSVAVAACSDTANLTDPAGGPLFSRSDNDRGNTGAVYVASNATAGNEVQVFHRRGDGSLATPVAFATGGAGTGGGLGNQGGVVLSQDNQRLFVVNAGSSEISMFAVRPDGLELLQRIRSGGERPVSIAVSDELVYVLNAGGTGNITGFKLDQHYRTLRPIAGSSRPLSSATAGASQVSFNPDGEVLVVTEKATNRISTYTVGDRGLARGPNAQASVGATPFGFAFAGNGTLVVSEAFGGAPDASALSSYQLGRGGRLHVVSASVGTTETAACWVVITGNGRFAYTTNTGSGTVSGYRIGHDGALALLDQDGVTGTTGAGPIDMALTTNSRYLYSLDGAAGGISTFGVNADGSLTAQTGVTGLPAGANGLAAR